MNEQIKQEVLNLIQNASAKAPEVLSQACTAQITCYLGDAIVGGIAAICLGIVAYMVRGLFKREDAPEGEAAFVLCILGFMAGLGALIVAADAAYDVVQAVSWWLNPYGELLLKLIGDAS